MDPMNRSSSSAALLVGAVAVPIAVCAVLSALIDVFVAPAAALVLVLVIVIVCLRGSWLVDALVIVVSAIGFDFFLTYPYRSMKIASRPDIEVTIVLFVVGAAIAGISRWALTASDLAERRQGYVTYALDARSGDMSRDEVAQRLAGLVGAEAGAWGWNSTVWGGCHSGRHRHAHRRRFGGSLSGGVPDRSLHLFPRGRWLHPYLGGIASRASHRRADACRLFARFPDQLSGQ